MPLEPEPAATESVRLACAEYDWPATHVLESFDTGTWTAHEQRLGETVASRDGKALLYISAEGAAFLTACGGNSGQRGTVLSYLSEEDIKKELKSDGKRVNGAPRRMTFLGVRVDAVQGYAMRNPTDGLFSKAFVAYCAAGSGVAFDTSSSDVDAAMLRVRAMVARATRLCAATGEIRRK